MILCHPGLRKWFDFEQKNLQFRNQGGGPSQTIFHGQGEGKEDRKEEILKFFRAVNKGLINQLNEEQLPLVVATMDHLFPIYQEANTYAHLEKDPIICNPAEVERKVLREKAWKVMQPKIGREKERKLELYRQFKGTQRTETDLRKIYPKAKLGSVDSLFVHQRDGLKDKLSSTMEKDPSHQNAKLSVLNQTAIAVYSSGGNVYSLTDKKLTSDMAEANALYRY